jgi:DNA-binding NtrC family response regulator
MGHKRKIRLLIVDDEKDIVDFEKAYFATYNFDVYTAQTGKETLALAKTKEPDIALIDIHLAKGVSGIEILQKLLTLNPQLKCVMTTWDREKAKEAIKKGAFDFVIKPNKIEDLERAVDKAVKQLEKDRE